MRPISFLFACVFASATIAASAQEAPATREFDLGNLAELLRPGGPDWQGRAEFIVAPGATAQIYVGERRVGDVIAEIDIATVRTAHLLADVPLTDAAVGERTIRAGAELVARNGEQVEVYPRQPPRVTDRGPLQWCVLDDAPLCIIANSRESATYREVAPGTRVWRGPLPVMRVESIAFVPPLKQQFVIARITENGVSLESYIARGTQRVRERGYGELAFGVAVRDQNEHGLTWRFRQAGTDRVIVGRPE